MKESLKMSNDTRYPLHTISFAKGTTPAGTTHLRMETPDAWFDDDLMLAMATLQDVDVVVFNGIIDPKKVEHHVFVALMPGADPRDVAIKIGPIVAGYHKWGVYEDNVEELLAS